MPYDDLSTILAIDAQGRRGRSAILRAQRLLLIAKNKYLRCVRTLGYEVANPEDMPEVLKGFRRASFRRIRKGHFCGAHTTLADIQDVKKREALILEQTKAGLLISFARRVGTKQRLETLRTVLIPSGKELARVVTQPVRSPQKDG